MAKARYKIGMLIEYKGTVDATKNNSYHQVITGVITRPTGYSYLCGGEVHDEIQESEVVCAYVKMKNRSAKKVLTKKKTLTATTRRASEMNQ